MPLPSINRRKGLETSNLAKNKFTTKRTETKNGIQDKSDSRESMDTSKKSHPPGSMNTHHKSDADKSSYSDAQANGSGEPYVHEFKEFPGVTIIFRSAANSRAYGNSDGHGKAGSRRKSEFTQSQLNMQDKFEHGDKTDHSGGTNSTIYATKSEVSTNNSNETSGNDN